LSAVASSFQAQTACGIIVTDCSKALSIVNKVFCIFLGFAMGNAFVMMNVPYSVVVFGDYDFQFVIKSFSDPHSPQMLQCVLDAVMVDQYGARVVDACHYAKHVVNSPGRPHQTIFVVSSGIDPNLVHVDDWKSRILADLIDSFGFYFCRSTHLSDVQMKGIEGVWSKFSAAVNSGGVSARYLAFNHPDIAQGNVNLCRQFHNVFAHLANYGSRHAFDSSCTTEAKVNESSHILADKWPSDIQLVILNDGVAGPKAVDARLSLLQE
jgi:hypothetical protein